MAEKKNTLPPLFEDLKTSTKTIMCYTNVQFDLRKVFSTVKVEEPTLSPSKKQKNIDKKNIRGVPGSIVSMHYQKYLRGVNLRKMKKYSCPRCKSLNAKGKLVKTVEATFVEKDVEGFDLPISTLEWYCEKCDRSYEPQTIGRKKIDNFLNQTTLILFLKEDHYINIMLFKNSLKIAGCKNNEDAITAVATLWSRLAPDSWNIHLCLERPFFIFEVVMRNVGFNLGFGINRTLLNLLMNETQFSDKIALSQFEPTGQTNVNIKMFTSKPKNFTYDCLVYPLIENLSAAEKPTCDPTVCPCSLLDTPSKQDPYIVQINKLFFKKAKDKPEKHMTFIVFSSSQTILSGKYDSNVKEQYQFFIETLLKYKERIIERLED
jgi:ribosomal protein L37AE/L43A